MAELQDEGIENHQEEPHGANASSGAATVGKGVERRLLAVLAHPDDETFGCGGLLAKYASEGTRVALVCATCGEVGEINDPSLATPGDLGQVREGELRAACDVLGIEKLDLLGYRDSGMAGNPDNEHPQALCRADVTEVAGKIVEVIRNVRPQVVVTFDPNGGYGHPDHIAIHRAAREAFSAFGDGAKYVERLAGGPEPYSPRKLYYMVFSRSMARAFQEAVREAGKQDDFGEMDVETTSVPDEDITTVLDVAKYGKQKEMAALCHRTQVGEDHPFDWIPESVRARFMGIETLVRAQPPFVPGRDAKEEDLFADIQD